MNSNILIVDDNQDYSKSLGQFLELEEYKVRIASSVKDALALLDIFMFELSLVDLRLTNEKDEKDFSGFEVIEKLHEKKIPCIIITAHATVDTVRKALFSRGNGSLAVDFVQKKDGPEAVLNAIRGLQGLTLLHLSDLHLKVTEDGGAFYDQERAYDVFLENIQNQSGLASYPFAGIVVSGDISFQCKKGSFALAKRFLENLAQVLKVPKEHIILAPGNHDIDREKAMGTRNSIQAIKANDPSWLAKFDTFLEFTGHFYGQPAFSADKLYRIFILDKRVAIVTFNSCIVEGDADWRCEDCFKTIGKEHYPGWINRNQIIQAGQELTNRGWNGLRIGVFHHHIVPEDWKPIVNGCRGEYLINYHTSPHRLEYTFSDQGFNILLHGHQHKGELKQSSILGSNVPLLFGSGAFWTTSDEKDETANCLLLQFSPLRGKSQVWMWRYAPSTDKRHGYWGADDSIQSDGIIPLPDIIVPSLIQNV